MIGIACCGNCRHFTPNEPKPGPVDKYNADTRPERPKGFLGGLKWSWNPQAYRREEPDEWDRTLQEAVEYDNANGGYCHRFPNCVYTTRANRCGEFEDMPA